ncbi:MAG: heavy metal-binding domain-containing protein [Thermodesulfobacteriota bacterium]
MNWVVYCTLCGSSYVYESGRDLPEVCPICANRERREGKKPLRKERKRKEIVAISTSEFKNRKVVKTLGIVSHEHIFGVNIDGADLKRFNREVAVSWAEKLSEGRDLAISAIEEKTVELGGNAVVGVDISYNVLGAQGGILMMLVAAKGTALVVD